MCTELHTVVWNTEEVLTATFWNKENTLRVSVYTAKRAVCYLSS